MGAWQGWRVALWAAWWTALAGAALALAVWAWRAHRSRRGTRFPSLAVRSRRGGRSNHHRPRPGASGVRRAEPFPYVPAILAGTALALVFGA